MVSGGIHPKIPAGDIRIRVPRVQLGVFNVVRGAQTREKELIDKGLPIGAAGGGGGAQ